MVKKQAIKTGFFGLRRWRGFTLEDLVRASAASI